MKNELNQREYLERLIKYTDACLAACSKESEKSVEVVGRLLDTLIKDVARVSSMSESTVTALNQVRGLIANGKTGDNVIGAESAHSLIRALNQISKENRDVSEVVMPLVTTLQFQDRVRQQMENVVKMLKIWIDFRADHNTDSDEEILEFGKLLAEPTTTNEERDVLKKVFPGLTIAEQIQNDGFFF
jgi:hypothetical protein